VCGRCLADPPAYEAHASAWIYAGPVRSLMLLYKDQHRYPLARLLGRALARKVRRVWPEVIWDAVVYAPSPFRRRMARGFEPAGLIARSAADHLGIPCRRWLRMRKSPKPQKGLSAAARRRNLRGAFLAEKGALKGQRVLLIDDIRTTGATLRETARVLKRAGASVHAATVAMVLPRELDLISGDVAEKQTAGNPPESL
jgi:ComF family protein